MDKIEIGLKIVAGLTFGVLLLSMGYTILTWEFWALVSLTFVYGNADLLAEWWRAR